MEKLPISVFIITRNEADRLPRVLLAVREWVSEIVVVDSGSTDGTQDVARSHGARVLEHAFAGYGPQKVFAESQCQSLWLLNLDADEEVSPELAAAIKREFRAEGGPQASAYRLPILPLFEWQQRGHPWTAGHKPVRLYRRDRAGFKADVVHDSVVVREGKIRTLKGMVLHRSFRSLTHHVEKVNGYSSMQGAKLAGEGRAPGLLALLFTPPLAFLKQYVLRREFVNGIDGIVTSHMYAFQRFIRIAKAREAERLAKKRQAP
jgi:glycosyltransferase involved in cell wall biosynthesis